MSSVKPRALIAVAYEEWARKYADSLRPEHYMEAIGQSKQREIALESLALLKARRADVHVFSELLVQYPVPGQRRPGQVVPDNMVVISDQPIAAETCFNTPLEPAGPFWVLEYVSKSNKRKDYEENFDLYERDLKVPYYLVFYPDLQDLVLYRHTGKKYISVKPNKHGRCAIPELDLEVGILDGWVRFWLGSELLPLPAELQSQLEEARRQAADEKQRGDREKRRADEEQQRAENEKKRADELHLRLLEAERQLAHLSNPKQPPARKNNGLKRNQSS